MSGNVTFALCPIGIQDMTEADAGQGPSDTICCPSTLTNPIHGIFERRNWRDISDPTPENDDKWQILHPSLQLASRILVSTETLAHISYLFCGTDAPEYRANGKLNSPSVLRQIHVNNENDGWSVLSAIHELLESLSGKGRPPSHSFFSFAFGPLSSSVWGGICNTEHIFTRSHYPYFPETTKVLITLNRIKFQPLFQAEPIIPAAQRLRVSFNFAITLIHELMHGMVRARYGTRLEPHLYDQRWAEVGFSWELRVLGGSPSNFVDDDYLFNGMYCASDKLTFREEYHHKVQERMIDLGLVKLGRKNQPLRQIMTKDNPKQPEKLMWLDQWPIPMSYIEPLFRDEFWQPFHVDLRIPKTKVFRVLRSFGALDATDMFYDFFVRLFDYLNVIVPQCAADSSIIPLADYIRRWPEQPEETDDNGNRIPPTGWRFYLYIERWSLDPANTFDADGHHLLEWMSVQTAALGINPVHSMPELKHPTGGPCRFRTHSSASPPPSPFSDCETD